MNFVLESPGSSEIRRGPGTFPADLSAEAESCLSPLKALCAYAGIVPRTHQSGGPDSAAVQGKASSRCNHILKDWTVQSAQKMRAIHA